MVRLHQTFGAHTGRVIELDREVIRFGRLPDNEVAFDPHADLDASGRHAELRREGGQWVLVDVGSRNGTLIGGQRVTRHVVTSGDEVEFGLGGPRVRIELVGAVSKETAQATPVSSPGSYATGPATPIEPSAAGIAPPSQIPVGGLPPVDPNQNPTPPPAPFSSPAPSQPGYPPAGTPAPGAPHVTPMMAQPTPVGPPGPKKYGQRTVGMMIQAAVEQERQRAPGKSTAQIHAVATQAAQRSNRGLKVGLGLVAFLLLLTAGAVVALFFYARWQEQELRDENVRLQRELTELGEGESEERERLEGRISDLNEQLGEEQQETVSDIAERHDGAVWALVQTRGSRRSVICSAFAVRNDLLATTAHCVEGVERALGRGDMVRAEANHGEGAPQVVQRMWRHPRYERDAPASPNVGLVRIAGGAASRCEIASMGQLHGLRAGDDVFVLGFPSALSGEADPVAGLTTGVIGRLTAFDGSAAPASGRYLVSHSAFSDDGTAGSPIFDREGRVVAINAGNMRARRRVTDTNTHVTRTVESDAPYAWAVRADLLLQLLAGLRD